MNFTKKEFMFASLVGGKLAESIPRLSLVQNELAKQGLPTIPFIPVKDNIQQGGEGFEFANWHSTAPRDSSKQFFPLTFSIADKDDFVFPYEPMVSVSSKNVIAKRYVAKANTTDAFSGSIKERYSQDDWSITITGILLGAWETGSVQECFPKTYFEALRDYCIKAGPIKVKCELLQNLNIHYIVIEEFSFPFSKGENVQAFEIKAVSDFSADILTQIGK